jgi:hypothetical protein
VPLISSRSSHRLLAAACLLAATAAVAKPPPEEPDNLLNDSVTLQAGIVSSTSQTSVRYDSTAGTPGTVVDGEKDLGLPPKKLIGNAELMFRMKKRHRIRIQTYYLPLDRQATTVLQKTINFGDTTYNVNDVVQSKLKIHLLAINYTYSIVKNDRVEIGASLGFDVVGLEADATVLARLRTESEQRSAPAPLGGLDGTLRISSRWYLEGRAQYVKADVQTVKGTFEAYQANLLYRMSPNVTFGLGYSGFKVDVSSEKPGDSGLFQLRSTGPQAFGRVGF